MVRRSALRRLSVPAVLGLVVTLLMLVPALPASAHATLLESTPSDGTVVDQGPATVTLRYDQPVGVSAGSVKVLAPNGSQVDSGEVSQRDGGRVVVDRLPAGLAPGTYTILWRVLSADTHSVFGATTFSVKTVSGASGAAAAAEAEQASGGSAAELLLSVSRFVFYTGLVLLVGGLLFLFFLWSGGVTMRPVRRMLWIGWGAAVLGTVGGLLMQGPYSQGLRLYYTFDPELIALVLPTRFGITSLVRLGLLAATAVVLMRLSRGSRRSVTAAGCVAGLGLLISTTTIGHSGSGDLVGFAFPADVLHLAAASAWVGGLVLLVAVLLRRPPAVLAGILPGWSRYAELCVAVLVITGIFSAWRQVRELGALTDTGYGRLLLVKVGLVAMMLALGAVGRARIRRHFDVAAAGADPATPAPVPLAVARQPGVLLEKRAVHPGPVGEVASVGLARLLRRTVVVEACLAVVVLAVTSVLASTTPARESYFPVFSQTATVTGDLRMRVELLPSRVGLNDMTVDYTAAAGKPADVVQVTGSWSLAGGDTKVPVTLVRTAAGQYALRRVQLPQVGTWQLAIDTQTGDFDSSTNVFTVRVR